MVLLTITPSIIEGLQTLRKFVPAHQSKLQQNENDPLLDDVSVGNPISNGQIVDLWTALRETEQTQYTLERLLQGSRVYAPPPPPKPEPVSRTTGVSVVLAAS